MKNIPETTGNSFAEIVTQRKAKGPRGSTLLTCVRKRGQIYSTFWVFFIWKTWHTWQKRNMQISMTPTTGQTSRSHS